MDIYDLTPHKISIHAAREGGDSSILRLLSGRMAFQSTPPVKAATLCLIRFFLLRIISIHAAREGGDEMSNSLFEIAEISIHAAREGGDRSRDARALPFI